MQHFLMICIERLLDKSLCGIYLKLAIKTALIAPKRVRTQTDPIFFSKSL